MTTDSLVATSRARRVDDTVMTVAAWHEPLAVRTIVVSRRRLFADLIAMSLGATSGADARPSHLERRGLLDPALFGLGPETVVLVDAFGISPDGSTLAFAKAALRASSALGVICAADDPIGAATWVEIGAKAVITEDATMIELADLIGRLARNENVLGIAVREGLLGILREHRQTVDDRSSTFTLLTPREAAVLKALARGISPEEVARQHVVSVNTVRTQIRSILAKLGVNSVLSAVATAYQSGWLSETRPTVGQSSWSG